MMEMFRRIIRRLAPAKGATKPGEQDMKSEPDPPLENPEELARKLAALSGDKTLAERLVKSGISSIRQLGFLPSKALLDKLGGNLPRSEEETLQALQFGAWRAATYTADKATAAALNLSPNGLWKVGGFPGKLPDHLTPHCGCGCCDSIFSLKAYLFDLLDLLAHYWDIDLSDVEALLQRGFEFSTSDLACEALNAPLPQSRIAVEVLETHLKKLGKALPSNDSGWKAKFEDGLLRLITPREVQIAILAGRPSTEALTIPKVQAQENLPADLATALTNWEEKLNTLVLNLAGIDEAVGLLSNYAQNFTGYAPNSVPEDATPEERRLLELTTNFEKGRDATLRKWLLDYRDALVAATGKNLEVLEAGLSISFSSGACRTTTRLQELVTSVQQIVENIRSGEIVNLDRRDVESNTTDKLRAAATLPMAEEAWVRLRDYETWLGYTYGWVYPENVIDPLGSGLLDPSTETFPLAVREAYLDWASGARAASGSTGTAYIATYDLYQLKESAKTESLRRWKASVDSKSTESENSLGISIGIPVEFLSDLQSELLFPLAAGRVLNQFGYFVEAHEWYRLLYDPITRSKSPIFDEIVADGGSQSDANIVRSGDSWLDDPFDPVSIANRRQDVWLRYTILSMVRNLIDWADDDFARGLPDTFQRAEERYELARKLLGARQLQNECDTIILDIQRIIEEIPGVKKIEAARYLKPFQEVRTEVVMKQAEGDIKKAMQAQDSIERKRAVVTSIMREAVKLDRKEHRSQSLAGEWRSKQKKGIAFERGISFQPDPDGPLPSPIPGPKPTPKPGSGGLPRRPPFDRVVPDRPFVPPLRPPVFSPPALISLEFCIPLNPALRSLRQQIETQLYKLNHCLDFVGEPQLPRVYGCDTYDAATGLINRPVPTLDQFAYSTDQPRYRYSFLVEKARQYVDVAQRIESLLLQALQNRDNEAFQQLKAEHAVELGGATVELRRLGQIEAYHGVDLAQLQSERADSQVAFWKGRVDPNSTSYEDGLSDNEAKSLHLLDQSAMLSQIGSVLGSVTVAAGVLGAVATASGVGAPIGVPLIIAAGVLGAGSALASLAQTNSAQANAVQAHASFERRFEEWNNQLNLANSDAQIADLQKTLANDRAAIADQEMVIAQMQLSQAREELRFLQTKITDVALYDWMVRVLSRDYRTLMQIAACVARMAQRALEFERQERVQIIVRDYWNIATGIFSSRSLTEEQRSLGLLGAERLLTDLTKLDAFKLATEKRRQQISKTISLARMAPTDLIAFRDSGVITFNTLMEWFDNDFQGHYLRLIKSVKVTILAIVPPVDGIHAMLHNTGESSVVVTEDGGLNFVKKRATRSFGESISLDAPFNESGLFALNYEDPMLLPFEGLGVETQWTLELPRGNNRFNFDTIADVLLAIDYTAEYSREYEAQQHRERAGVDVHEDTAVPLRLQFPDVWYHFKNNHKDTSGKFPPFPFKFHLPRTAFAPNLDDPIEVAYLTLLLSGEFNSTERDQLVDGLTIKFLPGEPIPISMDLHKGRVPRPGSPSTTMVGVVGDPGDSTSAFGYPVFGKNSVILSTRGGSARAARGLPSNPSIGTAAPDEWTIEFSPAQFPTVVDKISDVLFLVTVRGKRR